ncbi:uncharacterized protein LOC131068559 [Cryptomeria japonica]|uniref:uncharacterized protein LOC131068559 n=1 Tax=Cryptomeria japonica TaxID=3369 RepID=UPI0027DA92A3|nr:uncharacterized protein LOC131068559 [Cryptomeria japonica]
MDKGRKFHWRNRQQHAFEELKEVTMATILVLPNLQATFEVETDVSNYGMCAVLLQERLIHYHLETFREPLLNYSTYDDKELYAQVSVLKMWKRYLMEKEIIMHADSKPLQYLQAQK